ncbi:MAG: VOC family protein, partial [Halofilum sp. (in: g-proteobacteria)]
MQLEGIHHLTAVTARASENVAFYTQTLGMRLIKKTVNQDDTSAYHLFYGDGVASPGSDLTFFDFPVPPERRGIHSITRTGLRVAGGEALAWWQARFAELGVMHGNVTQRGGRSTLDFEDFEGQRLSLVDDGGVGAAHPWQSSP